MKEKRRHYYFRSRRRKSDDDDVFRGVHAAISPRVVVSPCVVVLFFPVVVMNVNNNNNDDDQKNDLLEENVPLGKRKRCADVMCVSDGALSDHHGIQDLEDDDIIFVGAKEGRKGSDDVNDDRVIVCGERRGRRRRFSGDVVVIGEKESTRVRQAKELLARQRKAAKRKSNDDDGATRNNNERKSPGTLKSHEKVASPRGPKPKKTPKCVICLDEIETPTATKCGHVYCYNCIRELIRTQKSKAMCPQCRKKINLSGLTKLILDN